MVLQQKAADDGLHAPLNPFHTSSPHAKSEIALWACLSIELQRLKRPLSYDMYTQCRPTSDLTPISGPQSSPMRSSSSLSSSQAPPAAAALLGPSVSLPVMRIADTRLGPPPTVGETDAAARILLPARVGDLLPALVLDLFAVLSDRLPSPPVCPNFGAAAIPIDYRGQHPELSDRWAGTQ